MIRKCLNTSRAKRWVTGVGVLGGAAVAAVDLVGFTAGHCGGPGAQVFAEGSGVPVGTVAAVGDGLDYAVIKFDRAKAIPTANFAGFAINGIGPNPDWHQPARTNGAANGILCGGIASIPGAGPHSAISHALFQLGNDGGPVTSNDLLIGLVYGGNSAPANRGIPEVDFTQYTKFKAILNDVNAKGSPGAGFTPIPA